MLASNKVKTQKSHLEFAFGSCMRAGGTSGRDDDDGGGRGREGPTNPNTDHHHTTPDPFNHHSNDNLATQIFQLYSHPHCPNQGHIAPLRFRIMSSINHSSKFPAPSLSRTRSTSETSVNPFSSPSSTSPSDPPFLQDNASSYSSHTLRTLHENTNGTGRGGGTDSESDDGMPSNNGPSTIHLNHHDDPETSSDPSSPASMQSKHAAQERRRIIIRAFAQLAILFVVCTLIMGGTLYFALPDIDDEDKPSFRIPKNFDQLKALNSVLQRYKDENFARVMLCWIMVYML